MLFQLPENLEDVAVYISQEWGRQDPSTRALSRDVVRDGYENVGTLGKISLSGWDADVYDQGGLVFGHTFHLAMSSEFCREVPSPPWL